MNSFQLLSFNLWSLENMPQIASFMSRLKISKPTKKTLFMSSIFQILNISKQQHYVFNCVVNNTLQM